MGLTFTRMQLARAAGGGAAGGAGALGDACHRLATKSKLSNFEIIYHTK